MLKVLNLLKKYTNYLAESYNEGATTHQNVLEYIEYLRENLEKVTEYAEYVAETVNSNLLVEDEAGIPAEEVEAELNDVTVDVVDGDDNKIDSEPKDVEADLELEGEGDAEGEEIQEEAGVPAEEIEADLEDVTVDVVDGDDNKIDSEPKDVEADLELEGEGDAEGEEITEGEEATEEEATEEEATEEVVEDRSEEIEDDNNKTAEVKVLEQDSLEAYKSEITNKLQALIEKAEAKPSTEPTFFKFISESNKTEFKNLTEEEQHTVIAAVDGRGYLTEGQILGLWKNSLIGNVITESTPNVIAMMPVEYHETWGKLSEGKKSQIMAQAKMHKLETAYQVANFWQTRDLRENAPVMEKLTMVNESKEEQKSNVGYDTTDIAAQIAARFKK